MNDTKKYMHHLDTCATNRYTGHNCDCGLIDAFKALDASTSRPDDEMPITEEWLLSVGLQRLNNGTFFCPVFTLFPKDNGWQCNAFHVVRLYKTRREVRMIASLLGVTLNEQGGK